MEHFSTVLVPQKADSAVKPLCRIQTRSHGEWQTEAVVAVIVRMICWTCAKWNMM